MQNFLKIKIRLIWVILASASTFGIYACKAGLHVDIFAFNLDKNELYNGKIAEPNKAISLDDPELMSDTNPMLCMTLAHWTQVRNYCGIHR